MTAAEGTETGCKGAPGAERGTGSRGSGAGPLLVHRHFIAEPAHHTGHCHGKSQPTGPPSGFVAN